MKAFTAVFHPDYSNLQKGGYDIAIFNGNLRGQWKGMSCSLHATCNYSNQLTLEQWALGP